MKFLKFTDPQGGEVWIGGQWVTEVATPTRGHFPATARTVITIGANMQAVTEPIDVVVRMLEAE